jgi:Methyltransferase domain
MSRPSGSVGDDPFGGRQPTSHERMAGLSWDAAYHNGPAPWDIGQPQPAVVQLASEGGFAGAVLDAGCGTGDNTLHLASLGLPVLGVDVAETALAIAREKAVERGIDVPTLARTQSVRTSYERRSTLAPDGRSPRSKRSGCRPDFMTTALQPGWRASNGSSRRSVKVAVARALHAVLPWVVLPSRVLRKSSTTSTDRRGIDRAGDLYVTGWTTSLEFRRADRRSTTCSLVALTAV